jgi:hypothetical protein
MATTRKPSPAQLAARAAFAARARAGTLKRKAKPAAKRKRNPTPKTLGGATQAAIEKQAREIAWWVNNGYFDTVRDAADQVQAGSTFGPDSKKAARDLAAQLVKAKVRKANPAPAKRGSVGVYTSTGRLVASCPSKDKARAVAQALADSTGKPHGIK